MEGNFSPRPEPNPQPVYIEEQEARHYRKQQARSKEMNAWFLLLAIFLVIFSAFGTGYLIVRPMFSNSHVK
ncbi:MAG: EscU/YscU/HrcU family type III secretion system export apparatus switch protein [Calothrix sp. SM1_7_51]|nr:EscU/YscU/HrcU family type III secretion system export apparatus switch protein [Calothrix sp. SM1_7_51]